MVQRFEQKVCAMFALCTTQRRSIKKLNFQQDGTLQATSSVDAQKKYEIREDGTVILMLEVDYPKKGNRLVFALDYM